jgi:hypothetical protein
MRQIRIDGGAPVAIHVAVRQGSASLASLADKPVSVHGCGRVEHDRIIVRGDAIRKRIGTRHVPRAAMGHDALWSAVFEYQADTILGGDPTAKYLEEIIVGAVVNSERVNALRLRALHGGVQMVGRNQRGFATVSLEEFHRRFVDDDFGLGSGIRTESRFMLQEIFHGTESIADHLLVDNQPRKRRAIVSI